MQAFQVALQQMGRLTLGIQMQHLPILNLVFQIRALIVFASPLPVRVDVRLQLLFKRLQSGRHLQPI